MREIVGHDGQRVPIRIWARRASPDAIRQLVHIARQPWVVACVCAMADVHVSEGVAVGTVFAAERVVVPGALGGDLGCGMTATRLGAPARRLDRMALEAVVAALERAIPTGKATHRGRGVEVPDALFQRPLSTGHLERARVALASRHLGTLGGGNHFVEIDRDVDGELWLLVHSGSRGLGAAIAAHHARAAGDVDRASLRPLSTEAAEGAAYLDDLDWALGFARENRRRLASRAIEVLADVARVELRPEEVVDVHHNFAARETWEGRALVVHRKGAIAAPRGALALVPGSMGSASYVVEGLGSARSFGSCSHGAGRVLRRSEARRTIDPAALARAMRGVVYPTHLARSLVEEAPAAYRDIGEVLDDQEDLVARRLRLEPIAVLKG